MYIYKHFHACSYTSLFIHITIANSDLVEENDKTLMYCIQFILPHSSCYFSQF